MLSSLILSVFIGQVASQQIWDVWQTTQDRKSSFTYYNDHHPINFTSPGAVGSADIKVDDSKLYQQMDGFGATLTDSAALTLSNLKKASASSYQSLLEFLFDPTDGANSAGLSYIRIPLGASDLSAKAYTYDDVAGDTSLSHFSIDSTPSYVFSTLSDIKAINNRLKLHYVPWSPPGWMKDSGIINGGSFDSKYTSIYANYLFKALQAWSAKGFPAYAVGIQNEPMHDDHSYPTAKFTADQEAQVANALRKLLDTNGMKDVKIVGYEHNWDNSAFPSSVLSQGSGGFSGVAWHCYAGEVNAMNDFHSAHPGSDLWFTECAGMVGGDWWGDLKWQTSHLWIGAPNNWARSALMWSLAADSNGGPLLPGTSSCGGGHGPGCRGVVTVTGSQWTVNQEFYGLAQANKAILPRDAGGPWGQRIDSTVGGSDAWGLVISAYQTRRNNPSDWNRYSLVVMNLADSTEKPIEASIEFRGRQAKFSFPVGITTLWWYAPPLKGYTRRTPSRHHAKKFRLAHHGRMSN